MSAMTVKGIMCLEMNERLSAIIAEASQVFILTDENVAPFGLPEVAHWLHCDSAIDIVIKAGEQHKNLQTVQRIWKTLMQHHADRNALMINLGGGTITDLGGFAASTYKRGIKFINVPTTFAEAEEVLIKPVFLSTLPEREILSGMAEMLKYGFIADHKLLEINLENYQQHIVHCGEIKCEIVENDPFEKGPRQVLNFGHTLGHAIESHCLTTDAPLLHGEAVALGMLAALWLSVKQCGLDEKVMHDYEKRLPMLLSEAQVDLSEADIEPIMAYLVHDKKNKGEKPQFVLLETVGRPVWGVTVDYDAIKKALEYIITKEYGKR